MMFAQTDKWIWKPVNSTWNSISKLQGIWKPMMLLTDPLSQSDIFLSLSVAFDLFGCVCPPQSSLLAIFASSEVKNLIYFFPQCHGLFLIPFSHSLSWCCFPLSGFLSGLFSFTINLLLLCLPCTMDFLPFQFWSPAAEYYMSEWVSGWAAFDFTHSQTCTYTQRMWIS